MMVNTCQEILLVITLFQLSVILLGEDIYGRHEM